MAYRSKRVESGLSIDIENTWCTSNYAFMVMALD